MNEKKENKKNATNAKKNKKKKTIRKAFRDVVQGLAMKYRDVAPDYVAFPQTEKQIEDLLKFCSIKRVAVVPYGGGSSVVGGVEGGSIMHTHRYAGWISVDLSRHFNHVVRMDVFSQTVTVQAGMFGPNLEAALAPCGLTLRYFPQSFEYSTVGGWLATRGAGHFATGPTHIDSFCVSLTMITPAGKIQTQHLPSNGAGPLEISYLLGSEGTFGIITEATLRVLHVPKYKTSMTIRFPSFQQDEMESMMMGIGNSTTLILGYESSHQKSFDNEFDVMLRICADNGGTFKKQTHGKASKDSTADDWKEAFIQAPYFRDELVSYGLVVETFETSCSWTNFQSMYTAVVDAAEAKFKQICNGKGFITCRFTHVYSAGTAAYFTVVCLPPQFSLKSQLETWDDIKQAVSLALVNHHSTITHHHATGRHHMPWYLQQTPPLFIAMLRSVKSLLDPSDIMNPGVLVPIESNAAAKL